LVDVCGPVQYAGIGNFGWVEAGSLARGEQPALNVGAFATLRRAGIGSVLSLRESGEPLDGSLSIRPAVYRPELEAELCREAGLTFAHVACRDCQPPSPESLVRALGAVRQSVEQGRPVFMHCAAGIGRTGVVAAAWLMHRGSNGTEAGRHFLAYMYDMLRRIEEETGEEQVGYLRNRAISEQWWALRHIAAALGTPIDDDEFIEVGPLEPPYAEGWDDGYARVLLGWRADRGDLRG